MSYEECIKIKQARLDWSCLLVSLECTDRHHSPSADDYHRQRSELLVIRFVIIKILIDSK